MISEGIMNDYYIEISGNEVTRYLDPEYKLLACTSCDGKGIFYFTWENSLYHSQVCGKCHGIGWYE